MPLRITYSHTRQVLFVCFCLFLFVFVFVFVFVVFFLMNILLLLVIVFSFYFLWDYFSFSNTLLIDDVCFWLVLRGQMRRLSSGTFTRRAPSISRSYKNFTHATVAAAPAVEGAPAAPASLRR